MSQGPGGAEYSGPIDFIVLFVVCEMHTGILFDETHNQSYYLITMIVMMLHRSLVVGRNEV
jgi:hypothetical protein